MLLFLVNVYVSHRKGTPPAPLDPWDARSLEWMTTNPPKEHNFDKIPTVHALDEFFHRKYEDRGTEEHHDYQLVAHRRGHPRRAGGQRRRSTSTCRRRRTGR